VLLAITWETVGRKIPEKLSDAKGKESDFKRRKGETLGLWTASTCEKSLVGTQGKKSRTSSSRMPWVLQGENSMAKKGKSPQRHGTSTMREKK